MVIFNVSSDTHYTKAVTLERLLLTYPLRGVDHPSATSSHLSQHWELPLLKILANLTDKRWYSVIILICILGTII